MQTFRNVVCSLWEKLRPLVAFAALTNGRLRRLAVRRKLEDACWYRSHAHCCCWRADTLPAYKLNPKLNQQPQRALFCLKLDNSCCYARCSCGTNCNVVVNLVQECKFFNAFYFRSTETFAGNDTFLRDVNSYKRALALRNTAGSWHATSSVTLTLTVCDFFKKLDLNDVTFFLWVFNAMSALFIKLWDSFNLHCCVAPRFEKSVFGTCPKKKLVHQCFYSLECVACVAAGLCSSQVLCQL